MGGGQQGPSSLKSIHVYPTMMILGTVITGLKKIKKIYKSRDSTFGFCWHNICSLEISKFTISRDTDIIAFWYIILDFLKFFLESLKIGLINMVTILMISAKMDTLGLLKIKLVLLRDSNYIVDVAMWSKFGNSNISIREVIITSIL